jgi:hypothetical protein
MLMKIVTIFSLIINVARVRRRDDHPSNQDLSSDRGKNKELLFLISRKMMKSLP